VTHTISALMSTLEQKSEAHRNVTCRFCSSPLSQTFVDLGTSPLCESYLSKDDLSAGEVHYPLHAYVCGTCFLVQLEEFESPATIFSNYAYFSSYSDSWVKHANDYCGKMVERFGLNENSFVIEAASNDGYLLQHFVKRGIPVLGIEPAVNVAKVAVEKGVPTLVRFLGAELARELARKGKSADLVVANNVLAQVPDLNDFVAALAALLKPTGAVTLEFPHLLRLMEHNEFDTIYHEHFSYFSLLTTMNIFEAHGLRVFDVEELWTHGGSLRVYACHAEDRNHPSGPGVQKVLLDEYRADLNSLRGYEGFSERVTATKFALLDFFVSARQEGKKVAGYGAPGKSATLLNYCGIRQDMLEYTVDRSPHKQGRFLPGTRIPIYHPDQLRKTKPDYVLILPWNFKNEIVEQLQYIREWGGRCVVPIPKLEIL
jgi:SAM-dependent methyltransferase